MKEKEMMIGERKVVKGDWIYVECKDKDGVVYSEEGSVVSIDDEEVNMFDGKEGWSVDRKDIVEVDWVFWS
jgi:hypothetical protein